MMELSYEKLLARLAKAEVRFLVVGGIAVTLQGYVRSTEDIDLLVDRASDNITRLLAVMSDYGEGFARELSAADFEDDEGAIRIILKSAVGEGIESMKPLCDRWVECFRGIVLTSPSG